MKPAPLFSRESATRRTLATRADDVGGFLNYCGRSDNELLKRRNDNTTAALKNE